MIINNHSSSQNNSISLAKTLTARFITLSSIALLCVSGVLLWLNFRTQQALVMSQQHAIALETSSKVSGAIEQVIRTLETATRVGHPFASTTVERESFLQSLLILEPAFETIALLNSEGDELNKVSRIRVFRATDLSSQKESRSFVVVRQNNNYIGDISISSLNHPLITIAVPVRDLVGNFDGALVAEVNIEFVWQLVKSLKLEQTGVVYVVDHQGKLVAFQDETRVLRGDSVRDLPQVQLFLQGEKRPLSPLISQGITGGWVLSTHIPLDKLSWAVMVEWPLGEAYRNLILNIMVASWIAGAITLIALIAGRLTAKRLTIPLLELTQTVTSMTAGGLQLKAQVTGPTEVRQLAEAFNSMTAQLQGLIGQLEKRVQERTQELQVALRETAGLFKAAQAILGANELEVICQNLIEELNQLVPADKMLLCLVDHEQEKILMEVVVGWTKTVLTSYQELNQGISGLVFRSGQPILSLHAYDGIEPAETRGDRLRLNTGALIVVPFVVNGKVIGTITALNQIGQPDFTQHDVDLLMALTTQAAAAIENVRLFKAAQEARDAAEKANKAKSVFLANMSHELRTPLNAVLGFSQLMQKDDQVTASQANKLHIINRSGEHLLDLINDVLEISKIEAGKIILHNQEFNLHDLLADMEAMFRLRVQPKGVALHFERAADVPAYLRADVGKLRQILINLLGNAVKFTSTGSVTLRVAVMAQDALEVRLHFAVEDTGYGISEAELGHLFETFVQTESGRNSQQGTGLGLAICRQFVRLMGGELRVNSQLGVGSCFEFDFNALVLEPLEVLPIETRRVIGLAAGQASYRVLVVDDRADNRELLREMLSPLGFEIQEAENGLDALAVWETWQPHYILLDIRMPVMDGYETTRQLRGRGAAVVIIGVTASAFEEERAVVLAAGCDDFIRKPIREEMLLEMLARHGGVQYLYDEAEVVSDLHEASAVAIPAEWLAQLHDAAIAGSYGVLIELATQIQELDESMGLQLLRWIDDFEYNQILEWVENNRKVV